MTTSETQTNTGNHGCLYGVGVGPGDPELLTRKALRILQQVPVICTPQSETSNESYALEIVSEFLDRAKQEILRLTFPTDDAEGAAGVWRRGAEIIAEKLLAGQDVAFITEGDPMLYSTFAYVLEGITSAHPSISVEIVPGVSSVMAAAASAAIPHLGLPPSQSAGPVSRDGDGPRGTGKGNARRNGQAGITEPGICLDRQAERLVL